MSGDEVRADRGTVSDSSSPGPESMARRLERAVVRREARAQMGAALSRLSLSERADMLAELLSEVLDTRSTANGSHARRESLARRIYGLLRAEPDISTTAIGERLLPDRDGHSRSRVIGATLSQMRQYGRVAHVSRGRWRIVPGAYPDTETP